MDFSLAFNFLIAILAIVNPIGKIPVWQECSADKGDSVRWRLAMLVTLTAGGILLGCLWGGMHVLQLFSIDLASFRVGGGIVILLVGLRMLHGKATDVELEEDARKDDPMQEAQQRFRSVIVPMAIPIIAGPGSITTTIVYASKAQSLPDLLLLSALLGGVILIIYISLLVAPYVHRVIGDIGLTIVTRVFGLLLIGIAVQLMATGLGELFPHWIQGESVLQDDLNGS